MRLKLLLNLDYERKIQICLRGVIPHPFVQHIHCLVLDHMPDGPHERPISDAFLEMIDQNYHRVCIAHHRHYVHGNLPFPEGIQSTFYVEHKVSTG